MDTNKKENKLKFTQFTPQSQPDIEFFDPPMCCPTGLCGPTLDQTLLDTSEMIEALQDEGIQVERYQMSSHPQAFLSSPEVMARVREKQMAALPLVVVHGKIIAEGYYPNIREIKENLNGSK